MQPEENGSDDVRGPTIIKDDARLPEESPEAFLTELVAGEGTFIASGIATIQIGSRTSKVHIQSVPDQLLNYFQARLKPKKAFPRVLTPDGRYVLDEHSTPYTTWLLDCSRLKILLAIIGVPLYGKGRVLVWEALEPDYAADIQQAIRLISQRNLPAALQAILDTGMTQNQMLSLLQQINQLTRTQLDAEQQGDLDDFFDA